MLNLNAGTLVGIITIRKGTDVSRMERVSTFKNIILDAGLSKFVESHQYMDYCHIGISNFPVDRYQTRLINKLRTTSTITKTTTGANNSDPGYSYVWKKRNYRFMPDGGLGLYFISEIGVGWNITGDLFNRALIKDNDGQPTFLRVRKDEFLDIEYELRLYPSTHTFSGELIPDSIIDKQLRHWQARAASNTLTDGTGTSKGILSYGDWSLDGGGTTDLKKCHFHASTNLPGLFEYKSGGGQLTSLTSSVSISLDPPNHSIEYTVEARSSDLKNTNLGSFRLTGAGAAWNLVFDKVFNKRASEEFILKLKFKYNRI